MGKNGEKYQEYLTGQIKFWTHFYGRIKISFHRFLLGLFTGSSLIATICCILMSPHFPENEASDENDEDDVFDQPDVFEKWYEDVGGFQINSTNFKDY